MIDTIAGAKSSAIIYSIAETAKANNLKPYDYFEFGKGALHRFPLAFLFGFAGVCQPVSYRFTVCQGSGGALTDFVQHKGMEGVKLNPVLCAVLLPIGIVGLAGENPLGEFFMRVADGRMGTMRWRR